MAPPERAPPTSLCPPHRLKEQNGGPHRICYHPVITRINKGLFCRETKVACSPREQTRRANGEGAGGGKRKPRAECASGRGPSQGVSDEKVQLDVASLVPLNMLRDKR